MFRMLEEYVFCVQELIERKRGKSTLFPKSATAYLKEDVVWFCSWRLALSQTPITWKITGNAKVENLGTLGKMLQGALGAYAFYNGFDYDSRAKTNEAEMMHQMGYTKRTLFVKAFKTVIVSSEGDRTEFIPTKSAGAEFDFLPNTLKTQSSEDAKLAEMLLQAFTYCKE